ncbi:hypothetical protein A3B33_02315 [Candidatus Adlerbacteria bacterium RIFCSPLOWO2_01_FULL_54_16]|uniref:Uncharacterized protein n=1 Tax=Candidatus Adlerbacteria bacterium RIFCSPLOWO2_01_FULL_54_16 TaxID=1797244 RepID=A0A1F4Y0P7_9BACT|nr:MAG: hypothetical protein A3B33_02315 [Candidatus Adlerbacteria bacterium RIFCSPLOWO2_01_FULL_54_16]
MSVKLKGGANDFRLLAIYRNRFSARVIEITKRCNAWVMSVSCFLTQTARGVHGKVSHILICHSKLDGHRQNIVRRIITTLWRCDTLHDFLLEQPTDEAVVYRIAREAVKFPTNNTLRLAILYTIHHIVENRTAWHFSRPLFGKLGGNL